MKTEDTNYVVVFRTGKPDELDMAKEALAEANIPYYAQHETFVGLIEAMPKVPLPWPDVWSVQVPQTAESTARKILRE